jgi:hypothetical protein
MGEIKGKRTAGVILGSNFISAFSSCRLRLHSGGNQKLFERSRKQLLRKRHSLSCRLRLRSGGNQKLFERSRKQLLRKRHSLSCRLRLRSGGNQKLFERSRKQLLPRQLLLLFEKSFHLPFHITVFNGLSFVV